MTNSLPRQSHRCLAHTLSGFLALAHLFNLRLASPLPTWNLRSLLMRTQSRQTLSRSGYSHSCFPSARNLFLVLISTYPVHSASFVSRYSLYFLTTLVLANAVFRVGPRNRIGHLADCHTRFDQISVLSAHGV